MGDGDRNGAVTDHRHRAERPPCSCRAATTPTAGRREGSRRRLEALTEAVKQEATSPTTTRYIFSGTATETRPTNGRGAGGGGGREYAGDEGTYTAGDLQRCVDRGQREHSPDGPRQRGRPPKATSCSTWTPRHASELSGGTAENAEARAGDRIRTLSSNPRSEPEPVRAGRRRHPTAWRRPGRARTAAEASLNQALAGLQRRHGSKRRVNSPRTGRLRNRALRSGSR